MWELSSFIAAAHGFKVVIVARSKDKLENVKQEIEAAGGEALAVSCDITNKQSVDQLKEHVETRYPGGISVLVNNAAYVPPLHTFVEGDVEQWQQCVGVNVWGALHVTRYVRML